jgi:hypothetical protein
VIQQRNMTLIIFLCTFPIEHDRRTYNTLADE